MKQGQVEVLVVPILANLPHWGTGSPITGTGAIAGNGKSHFCTVWCSPIHVSAAVQSHMALVVGGL